MYILFQGMRVNTPNNDDYEIAVFEHLRTRIPKGYDQILTLQYGDYMKMPPKEDQVAHHHAKVEWK